MTQSRDEVIKAAEPLTKWLEQREFEAKELGLDFIHLHVKKSALIRSLIALVPDEGSVVYKATLKSEKKKMK